MVNQNQQNQQNQQQNQPNQLNPNVNSPSSIPSQPGREYQQQNANKSQTGSGFEKSSPRSKDTDLKKTPSTPQNQRAEDTDFENDEDSDSSGRH